MPELAGNLGELTIETQQDGYPTLRTVEDETYWCEDCSEDHTDSHLECPICGEVIKPGTKPPPPWRESIPGPVLYRLNGEPINKEQAQDYLNGIGRADVRL